MRKSWWDTEFRKFGHAGIKAVISSPASGERRKPQMTLSSRYKNVKALLSKTCQEDVL